jgi:protein phosphatase
MEMKLESWAATDVGHVRQNNEDSVLIDGQLYLVADGMGGHAGGKHASSLAVQVLASSIRSGLAKIQYLLDQVRSSEDVIRTLETAWMQKLLRLSVDRTSFAIFDRAQHDEELLGMGTTVVGLVIHKEDAYVFHAGDSRCYLIRESVVKQLTRDHSWVNEQIDAGLMAADDADRAPFQNLIMRAVGTEPTCEADVQSFPVLAGDLFVLCSDGLSNHVPIDDIAHLASIHRPSELADVLVSVALERGGDDNVTVVVVDVSSSTNVGAVRRRVMK